MIITGLAGIVLILIYAAVMQRVFQNTDNRVGKGFAILGIYLFVVCYCEFPRVINKNMLQFLSAWMLTVSLQMECLTARHGFTALKFFLLHFAVKLWGLLPHPTSFSTWPVGWILIYQIPLLISQLVVTEAGPSAFANIKENYYYVFVACSLFFLVIAYLFFPYVVAKLEIVRRALTFNQ